MKLPKLSLLLLFLPLWGPDCGVYRAPGHSKPELLWIEIAPAAPFKPYIPPTVCPAIKWDHVPDRTWRPGGKGGDCR